MGFESITVLGHYEDYLKIVNMARLVAIYNDVKGDLPLFIHLFGRIKKERRSKPQIPELLKTPNFLLDLKEEVDPYKDQIWNPYSKKLKLKKEIDKKIKRLLAL